MFLMHLKIDIFKGWTPNFSLAKLSKFCIFQNRLYTNFKKTWPQSTCRTGNLTCSLPLGLVTYVPLFSIDSCVPILYMDNHIRYFCQRPYCTHQWYQAWHSVRHSISEKNSHANKNIMFPITQADQIKLQYHNTTSWKNIHKGSSGARNDGTTRIGAIKNRHIKETTRWSYLLYVLEHSSPPQQYW